MGNLISREGGQAIRTPSEPVEVSGIASVLFPDPEWVVVPGRRNHLVSLDVESPLPTPSLPSPGTCHWLPSHNSGCLSLLLAVLSERGESCSCSWMLAAGSHFKKLHVADVPTVVSPCRFLSQSHSGSRRQRGGGWVELECWRQG